MFIRTYAQKIDRDIITIYLNHLLVIYAFLLPFNHYRANGFIIGLMLLLIVVRGNYRLYLANLPKEGVVWIFLVFYLLHAFWYVSIDAPTYLVETIYNNVEYSLFLPIFLMIVDKRFSLRILSAFLLAMMFSEIVSYAMHFHLLPPQLIFKDIEIPFHSTLQDIYVYDNSGYVEDPAPFLKHSTYTAALAFSVAVMVYQLIKQKHTWTNKSVMIFFIITMTFNISIVGGRVGYVIYSLFLTTVMIFIFRKRSLLALFLTWIFITIIGFIAYENSTLFKKRVNYTIDNIKTMVNNPTDFSSSEGGRIGMWYYGIDVIKDNLLFGVSNPNFVEPVYEKIPPESRDYFKRWYFMPHNFYLTTLLQFGLVGLIILLSIFIVPFFYGSRDPEIRIVRILAIFTILLGLMTTDLINYYHFPFLVLMIAITSNITSLPSTIKLNQINMKIIGLYFGISVFAFLFGILQ